MKIILTAHAKGEIKRRKLSISRIEAISEESPQGVFLMGLAYRFSFLYNRLNIDD
ncbi:MAG: hypothetical protein ACE5GQ_07750 [Nitrospinales bacterium]